MTRSRPPRSWRRARGAAGSRLGALLGSALLLAEGRAPPAAACPAPVEVWQPPPQPAVRPVDRRRGLRIVALGSSSTQGTPLDRPDSLWPARLETLLRDRLGDPRVAVVNRGVGGETAADNLVRLDRDAIAPAPDLVVWQVGSNDALAGLDPAAVARTVGQGIRRLRAAGIAVVLMDGQWLPAEGPDGAMRAMGAALAEVAASEGVALFPRHRLMQALVERGLARPDDLVGPDGLHMTASAHHCLAERLADLLAPPPAPVAPE